MSVVSLLRELTVVLLAAAAAMLVFRRLRQPPVLGYIAAGVLAAPLVADRAVIEALSEVGVVFLLFALGVEFNLKRLAAVGMRAMAAAGLEALAVVGGAMALGALLGLPSLGAALLGAVLALASTAIVARSLLARAGAAGWMELAAGVLVAEDILAVAFLALFSSAGAFGGEAALAVLWRELTRFGMLATLVLVSGLLVLPRILRTVESSGLREVRTLVIVGTCFALSLLTRELGFSSALGAFLAGAMMSETAAATRLRETAEPFKDVFGSVFFVSVGLLLDGGWLLAHWRLALALSGAAILARLAVNAAAFAAVGEDARSAVHAAAARLPIGEFSFLLARLGDAQGLTPVPLFPLSVAVCAVSTFTSGALLEAFRRDPASADRLVPARLARLVDEYRAALRRLQVPRQADVVWRLTKPSLIQIALNLLGLSGIFLAAGWFHDRPGFAEPLPGGLWMLTAVLTLPFLMALWRKTQAVALILLEAATARSDDRPPAEARPRLTRLVLGAATAAVAWWYLSLSLPLLPRGAAALGPLAAIALAGVLLWRAANRLYAGLQAALRDALAKGGAGREAAPELVSYFVEQGEGMRVVTLRLSGSAKALGRSLAELDVRGATGASVLQLNRRGAVLVAPPADTRFQAGDEVLLVGSEEQVAAARELLS